MATETIHMGPAPGRARALYRLVVRNDVTSHNGPPLAFLAAVCGIVAVCYLVALMTRSPALAAIMIALMLVFMIGVVAACIRIFYCAANPYLSLRWLAAAQATFGDEIMAPVLAEILARRSPDEVLRRAELIEAIIARRRRLNQAGMATRGVRMRDIAGQG